MALRRGFIRLDESSTSNADACRWAIARIVIALFTD